MKLNLSLVMTCLLLVASPGGSASNPDRAQSPGGRVIDYGIYRVISPGGLVASPGTNTGLAHGRSTVRLQETTRRIPLEPGLFFAFYARLEPFPDRRRVQLRKVVRHPEMRLPDGSRKRGYELVEHKRVRTGTVFTLAGYVFDEEYEMVEGEWRIQYWYGKRLLVEQTFETYRPDTAAPAAAQE